MAGLSGYLAGQGAEAAVARHYETLGFRPIARRWRTERAEIDLVMGNGRMIVFVEVKAARDFATAAARLKPAQFARIALAAEQFLAAQPLGALTPARIDAALVDRMGRIEVIENMSVA
jgi:putative endonuclease